MCLIAIVPTACGIETLNISELNFVEVNGDIAIVPTACGIETLKDFACQRSMGRT